MERVPQFIDSLFTMLAEPLAQAGAAVFAYAPTIIGALLLFLIGRVIARMVASAVRRLLNTESVTSVTQTLDLKSVLGFVGIKQTFGDVVAKVLYWVIVLFFATSAFQILGLDVLVTTLQDFIAFLPNIFLAAVVMMLAMVVSRLAKSAVISSLKNLDVSFGGVLGAVAQIIVIYFGAIVAAEKLQFDVDVIATNASYVVIGIVAIAVIALGWGTKNAAANLIASYYVKQLFKVGDAVELCGQRGNVKEINNIAVVIQTESGIRHIPNSLVLQQGSATVSRG